MLTSPGRSLVRREELEIAVTAEALAGLRSFFAQVVSDAMAAQAGPVVVAAGIPDPLTLGMVLAHWSVQGVRRVVRVLGRAMGLHTPEAVAADPYLTQIAYRLGQSPIPASAFEEAKRVLTASVEERWSRSRVEHALLEALDPDAPPATEGQPRWTATARRSARTESTAVAGHLQLRWLAEQGFTGKRWVAHHDEATRPSHAAADGQTVPLGHDFVVGGWAMTAPADPRAPTEEVVNCRCVVVGARVS